MNTQGKYKTIISACAVLFISFLTVSCNTPKNAVNADTDGTAIKGYDTVAYFTMGQPVKGDDQFAYTWNGARWLFARSEHLDLFRADPEKYAPQYGGY